MTQYNMRDCIGMFMRCFNANGDQFMQGILKQNPDGTLYLEDTNNFNYDINKIRAAKERIVG